ncbi:TIGR01777 family oxidoreductase [Luedemannella helvata]|uniref:TIGR01777 family oxidoreductase n=1 Tax=Luedemannella helvata TaxID=349315 RepID=A0ABN2JZT2_9ACTN
MRIVLAGGSGFLGARLRARFASADVEVVNLVRRPPAGPDEVRWWPDKGELAPATLAGADAVINLAGAPVAPRRWTSGYRATLVRSRVQSTATIARTLAALPAGSRPDVLLNASGVGFYGDTGDTAVDETAPAGDRFLSELAQLWEAAAEPAAEAGVRVVLLRTGLPLHASGGLLKPLLIPFRLGLGARFGGGGQWWPWISITDWEDAVRFLLDRAELSGAVNLTGPHPDTNAEFTRTLAQLLRRPALLTVPSPALKLAVGGFADEALISQRVLPGVLTSAGFAFRHPTLREALSVALDLDRPAGLPHL